ncbi:hypothetical protein ACX40Y_05575 [Sphingomonas sp. RS6]
MQGTPIRDVLNLLADGGMAYAVFCIAWLVTRGWRKERRGDEADARTYYAMALAQRPDIFLAALAGGGLKLAVLLWTLLSMAGMVPAA